MRKAIFSLVAFIGDKTIKFIGFIGRSTAYCIGLAVGGATFVVANIFQFTLKVIDKDRLEYTTQIIEQESINAELEILATISKVKEEALSDRRWTDDHTRALNILGHRLYSECDWSENNIHVYMREIVESIPGLSYGTPSDMEDDGIDLDDLA